MWLAGSSKALSRDPQQPGLSAGRFYLQQGTGCSLELRPLCALRRASASVCMHMSAESCLRTPRLTCGAFVSGTPKSPDLISFSIESSESWPWKIWAFWVSFFTFLHKLFFIDFKHKSSHLFLVNKIWVEPSVVSYTCNSGISGRRKVSWRLARAVGGGPD